MNFLELKESMKGLSGDDAVKALSEYIESNPNAADLDEALTYRGIKYWGMQKRSLAINDYLAAIKLNPQSKAVQALKAANDILDYYNKDLYNP